LSECAWYPTNTFPYQALPDEVGKHWKEGYMKKNFKVVPNTEIPKEFLETGRLSKST
jgi:hypothetical protein